MNVIANPIGLVLASLLFAGCVGEANVEDVKQMISRGEPVLATTRLENRVTIYEHSSDAFDKAPQWTLESAPSATIGGAIGDSTYELTRVSYVVPLSDGRVMTFAAAGNHVFVFDRDGKGKRVISTTGQGHEEWRRFPDPVLLENDTVLILDFTNRRLNWVTADGGIVRSAPYDLSGGLLSLHRIAGLLSTEELLMHSAGSWSARERDSQQRGLATVIAANITTAQLSSARPNPTGSMGNTRFLGRVPDQQEAHVETRYRGQISDTWRPLSLGGSALLAAWDSVYASVQATSRSIEVRNAEGALVARIDIPSKRRGVTRAMRDAHVAIELAGINAPGQDHYDRAESERLARESPFADSLPYFSQMFVGSDRTLWIVDAIAPNDSGWTATALRDDGAILARLTANGKSVPMAFGANQVIVRAEDANGVVSLRVYRFTQ